MLRKTATSAFLALVLFLIPLVAHAASEEEQTAKRWVISISFGDFKTTHDDNWQWPNRFALGIEISNLISSKSAFSFTVSRLVYSSTTISAVPLTFSYKFFPLGNHLHLNEAGKAPALQPWVGAGAGIYIYEPNYLNNGSINPGVHFTAGLILPLSGSFEMNGEFRLASTRNEKFAIYSMGLGFRF